LSIFAPSHQQPPADELQENFSPQASQVFCVGESPAVCGPVKPALMSHRLFLNERELGNMALNNFFDLFLGHGSNQLIRYLPTLKN